MIHGIFVKKLSINKELHKKKEKIDSQLMICAKLLLFSQLLFCFSKKCYSYIKNNTNLVFSYSKIVCVILHCYNSIKCL